MKNRIGKRLFIALMTVGAFIILLASATVAVQYWKTQKAMYTEEAFSYTDAAAAYIDGDKIAHYLETGETDEYYESVQVYLDSIAPAPAILYFYVFFPGDDVMTYIWDSHAGQEELSLLGDTEIYGEPVRKLFRTVDEKSNIMGAFDGTGAKEIHIYNMPEYYGYLACAYSRILDSNGNPVAIAAVDMSMPNIIRDLIGFVLAVAVSTIAVIALSLGGYLYYIKKIIINPLNTLNEGASSMVSRLENNEIKEIELTSGDEFQAVAESFNKMDREVREYITKLNRITAEKERIGAELNVATQIQADMLPTIFPAFPDRPEIDLYAAMDPAKEVGGDFYDFFEIGDNKMALIVADVSGKGVPAALFMVIAKTLIKNYAIQGFSPSEVLGRVNDQLCEGNKAELFVTVWLAVIDITTGEGTAANAGHEHPALYRAYKDGVRDFEAGFELVKYKHSVAVATMEGVRFREHEFKLNPGDTLFVYTDGVTEATNADNCLFGDERLLASLNAHKEMAPTELLKAVRKDIDEFVGEAPQFDDLTMMAFTYKASGSSQLPTT